MADNDIIKKPYSKSGYTDQSLLELSMCVDDPMYFMRNFMKIQHPLRGAIPFEPYPFQVGLINAFHQNRFSVALTARQMGKCLVSYTNINKEGKSIEIGTLVNHTFRDKFIGFLERALLKLAIA